MKKDSLEKQWRKTLQDAELEAPMDIWENISAELEAEESFEINIKNTLQEAEIKPEESVWASIVSALDKEEERKPFILFWLNRKTAVGIAAVLLAVLGFSIFNNYDLESSSNLSSGSKRIESQRSRGIQQDDKEISSIDTKQNQSVAGGQVLTDNSKREIRNPKAGKVRSNSANGLFISDVEKKETPTFRSTEIVTTTDEEEISLKNLVASINYIAKKRFDEFGNSIILKRNKLSFETPEEYTEDNRSFLQKSWFGLISGLSPFDPNFKINNFERAALVSASDVPRSSFEVNNVVEDPNPVKRETFAIPLSQPYNDVKSGTSVNFGFDYGKRMGRLFSWQGGLRYMSGSSRVASNVYSYNERTGDIRTFLESHYIRQDISSFDNTVISSGAYIDNDYKYLMLPIQVGFHLPVTNKLEMAVNTGFSGDIIINNVLDNTPVGGSKLNSANSAYKAINLSGIGSMKVNYMVRDNWQLSVGTNFQQTLTSGVEKTEGFTFRPRYLGINYGVNYRFN